MADFSPDIVARVARAIAPLVARIDEHGFDSMEAATAALQASGVAELRDALEIVANGDVDVSDTAIIVGNGASTVIRQLQAALSHHSEG